MSSSSKKQKAINAGKYLFIYENASSDEKALLINTFNFVKNTGPGEEVDIIEETSNITGISIETIKKVLAEHKVKPFNVKRKRVDILVQLNDNDKCAIRQKVHNFYLNGELPFLKKLLKALNNDENLPNFSMTSLKRVLRHLKFTFKIKASLVMDRTKMAIWRIHYLRDMEKFRKEKRRIFYLDETWVDAGHSTMDKTSEDQSVVSVSQVLADGLTIDANAPTSEGKRLIIAQIGNEDGFLKEGEWIFESTSNDNQEIMDAPTFEKWFEKILSILQPNDVLVMDNTSYHSRLTEETPTVLSKIKEIKDWLKARSIPFDKTDTHAELVVKVKSLKDKYEIYAVDEMAKAKGVTVMRIPAYHSGLNPFELIWADLKVYVSKHNTTFKMSDVKRLVKEGLAQIVSDKWKHSVEQVIKKEEKMAAMDHQIDDAVDAYYLTEPNITGSSEDEETSNSSDSVFFSSLSESDFDSCESEFEDSESD